MRRPRARALARMEPAIDEDAAFFAEHSDRLFRIREPRASKNVLGWTESEVEFRSLGTHERHRRRIIVHNFGKANPLMAAASGVRLMRIPFLLFADETVEDRDDILATIFHGIMREAEAQRGVL